MILFMTSCLSACRTARSSSVHPIASQVDPDGAGRDSSRQTIKIRAKGIPSVGVTKSLVISRFFSTTPRAGCSRGDRIPALAPTT
ncbi:MAG: hypothetical protein U0610_24165 [bacterium]